MVTILQKQTNSNFVHLCNEWTQVNHYTVEWRPFWQGGGFMSIGGPITVTRVGVGL